jgi:hypothetical protein
MKEEINLEEMRERLHPSIMKAFSMPREERAKHSVCLVCFGLFLNGTHDCIEMPSQPKEICGQKATVTKLCLLPKGHAGAHDEDP